MNKKKNTSASSNNSPLLGYNTNVKHLGKVFHIQTEDSGKGHPHIITHLFVSGTILATQKTPYDHILENVDFEAELRDMMKNQHKKMFVELGDGTHDEVARKILGDALDVDDGGKISDSIKTTEVEKETQLAADLQFKNAADSGVIIMTPAQMNKRAKPPEKKKRRKSIPPQGAKSVFSTPSSKKSFDDDVVSDKSLDEVILSYLTSELED